jgi:hypothetical protein
MFLLRHGNLNYAISPSLLVGRSRECDLLLSALIVSRQHCYLQLENDVPKAYDLGSRHGTFVNDKRIGPGGVELSHQDRLRLGKVEFTILEVPDRAVVLPPKRDKTPKRKPSEADEEDCRTLDGYAEAPFALPGTSRKSAGARVLRLACNEDGNAKLVDLLDSGAPHVQLDRRISEMSRLVGVSNPSTGSEPPLSSK